MTVDTPPKPDPSRTPGVRGEPPVDVGASLAAGVIAFGAFFGLGAFVQMYVFLALVYAFHDNRPMGVLLAILLIGLIEYFVLGRIVERRKRAVADGLALETLPEMALLGIALSTLLTGVCAATLV